MPYSIYKICTEIINFEQSYFFFNRIFHFSYMVFAINTTCSKIIRPTHQQEVSEMKKDDTINKR